MRGYAHSQWLAKFSWKRKFLTREKENFLILDNDNDDDKIKKNKKNLEK